MYEVVMSDARYTGESNTVGLFGEIDENSVRAILFDEGHPDVSNEKKDSKGEKERVEDSTSTSSSDEEEKKKKKKRKEKKKKTKNQKTSPKKKSKKDTGHSTSVDTESDEEEHSAATSGLFLTV
jgi:hypothetical protein